MGDVGYGKTEVAIRAAFKAVQGGKQVAVLVPTTILAEQHGRTFSERLADFPVKVEVLSRFRTAKEQKAALERLADGEIDIVDRHPPPAVEGRRRSRTSACSIVDEEHRFGVKHKERLKALRLAVDVLTLTATPIPRTLHLSLAGLRDLSLIETPPRDRSPILTFVEPWDDALLEDAFARELDRGGQVFVVHNRIETIDTIAGTGAAPGAAGADRAWRTGRCRRDELETVMRRFVDGEVDILVSTMIVESGLDVPNANTMVVHDAHRFGLAQLYQLRGRVGRSHRRAYCYLMVPDAIDADAEERLEGPGAPYRPGRGLPDRAQGPRAARRGQPARRRAVGPRARGRVRSLPALAGGDRPGPPGPGRGRAARPAGRGARPSGALSGRLRARRRRQARPLPPTGAGRSHRRN